MTVAPQRITPPEILGNLEALDQCKTLIEQLAIDDYTRKPEPYVNSSIGEHVRHILDVYSALMAGAENGQIDYNFKRRGAEVERCRDAALAELNAVRGWLAGLAPVMLSKPVRVTCEVTLHEQSICEMNSSWQRELVFAASHVVHHCAVIGVATRISRVEVDELFGVAPATSTYWRRQK